MIMCIFIYAGTYHRFSEWEGEGEPGYRGGGGESGEGGQERGRGEILNQRKID